MLGGWDDLAVSDSDTGIDWHWAGARQDFGLPGQQKRFTYCTPLIVPSAVTSEIEVGWLRNEVSAAVTTTYDQTTTRVRPLHMGRYAERLGMYFAGAGTTTSTRILGWDLDMTVIGRR